MRGRVPQYIQAFQRLRKHRFNLHRIAICLRFDRVGEINFVAIDACGEGLLRQIAVKLFQSFGDGDGRRD